MAKKPSKNSDNKSSAPVVSKSQQRKARNRELNESRHQANLQYLNENRVSTSGKRPSKLVRKDKRLVAALNLGWNGAD